MKANCYECQYRRDLAGDCHSCCNHPDIKQDSNMFVGMVQLMRGEFNGVARKLNIQANYHGIKNGWFMWPVNFDPVWLQNCDGFKQKEKK